MSEQVFLASSSQSNQLKSLKIGSTTYQICDAAAQTSISNLSNSYYTKTSADNTFVKNSTITNINNSISTVEGRIDTVNNSLNTANTNITNLLSQVAKLNNMYQINTITIPANGWSNNQYTTSEITSLDINDIVYISPSPNSWLTYSNAGCYCSNQEETSSGGSKLTFIWKNTSIEKSAITINLFIIKKSFVSDSSSSSGEPAVSGSYLKDSVTNKYYKLIIKNGQLGMEEVNI